MANEGEISSIVNDDIKISINDNVEISSIVNDNIESSLFYVMVNTS